MQHFNDYHLLLLKVGFFGEQTRLPRITNHFQKIDLFHRDVFSARKRLEQFERCKKERTNQHAIKVQIELTMLNCAKLLFYEKIDGVEDTDLTFVQSYKIMNNLTIFITCRALNLILHKRKLLICRQLFEKMMQILQSSANQCQIKQFQVIKKIKNSNLFWKARLRRTCT